MAERSFAAQIADLRLGEGETFTGEGILAITKALLENGVGYVGGYQGAPISHLMDVLADAEGLLGELGVRFEASANEAAAAAMLAASVHYPIRGAVTFKGPVGVNVASDALANLASSGVTGGALVIVGEDYGEGSSIMQERSHAFAMKSQVWLLDPRPNLPSIVRAVGDGFALSEASNTPVMLMVRIRSCHVTGQFTARNNRRPALSVKDALSAPRSDFSRVVLPPMSFAHEQDKIRNRLPAALRYIAEQGLNEVLGPADAPLGLVVQGGMFNGTIRALQRLGLADQAGASQVPIYVLNVTYPLLPDEVLAFAKGKDHLLVIEEGQPDFIEQALGAILYRAGGTVRLHGKDVLPMAGEYTGTVMMGGIEAFLKLAAPQMLPAQVRAPNVDRAAVPDLSKTVPIRPPGFCTGCPERPIFAALKLVEKELGKHQIAADIGCHLFGALPPFEMGGATMGYGLGPAANGAFDGGGERRPIAIIGDGGFWHNGLSSSFTNMAFNKSDGVALVVDNFYSAATGGQDVMSSRASNATKSTKNPIARALRGVGIEWVRQVNHTYDVGHMRDVLREALTTDAPGPKVIVASSECMLNKQRRERPQRAAAVAEGRRVEAPRFGVDAEICTGDHACIRLSGCPSLSLKKLDDPLRDDPVAHIDQSCVGCGNCGEVADAAVLCPSFYRADVVHNPGRWEARWAAFRARVIGWLMARAAGWAVQATSVAGVAQRTGATIYYIEMSPEPDAVFALMPSAGDVDIMITAEMMEAGRAILRGFVTPDRTVLITSTHRALAVSEKVVPGDGISNSAEVMAAAQIAARAVIAADYEAIAVREGSVISASLLGALAGSGALPFERAAFEAVIGGKGAAASLRAFAAGYAQNGGWQAQAPAKGVPWLASGPAHLMQAWQGLVDRVGSLPAPAQDMVLRGLQKVVEFQDIAYGAEYLSRLAGIAARDHAPYLLTVEAAKYLANAMAYDDVIRVADLKTRAGRRERIAAEMGAGQVMQVTEFFHPRVEEVLGLMPRRLGLWMGQSRVWTGVLRRLFAKGRRLRSDGVVAFIGLYLIAGLKSRRRGSLRHAEEVAHLEAWLLRTMGYLPDHYDLAVEVIRCRRLIKGYSDTHARGVGKYDLVMTGIARVAGRADAADWARRLREAALLDEEGKALRGALQTIETFV